jgi:SRSO17 transposase
VFQTKPELALEMVKQVTAAGIPYSWVTGDCVYGDYDALRLWLEEQGKGYVLCVSSKEYLVMGEQKFSVSAVLKMLDENKWFSASCGGGSKGERVYDWQLLDLPAVPMVVEGWRRQMLVRKSRGDGALLAHVCFAPKTVSVQKLVEVAGVRWTVEMCFAESKSEVGLDHYEVQSYLGWYRHVTFACLAHALLTVLSGRSLDTVSLQGHDPGLCSLSEFKKKRGLHG